MKATFIINFMRENGLATPTNRRLREFGHDLTTLFDHLADLDIPGKPNPLQEVKPDSVERMILTSLAAFAKGSRYYNLNCLAGSSQLRDPLEMWNSVIERVLMEDVRLHDLKRAATESAMLANDLDGLSSFRWHDLEKQSLNTASTLALTRFHDLAAGHVVYHTIVLIKAIVQQLEDVSNLVLTDPANILNGTAPIPYMAEFFYFIHQRRKDILRKRRWQ